jgi:hypothetical protein
MVMPAAPTAALIKIQSEFLTEPGLIAGKRASVTVAGSSRWACLPDVIRPMSSMRIATFKSIR